MKQDRPGTGRIRTCLAYPKGWWPGRKSLDLSLIREKEMIRPPRSPMAAFNGPNTNAAKWPALPRCVHRGSTASWTTGRRSRPPGSRRFSSTRPTTTPASGTTWTGLWPYQRLWVSGVGAPVINPPESRRNWGETVVRKRRSCLRTTGERRRWRSPQEPGWCGWLLFVLAWG